jgi:GTP cyclohydrolase I
MADEHEDKKEMIIKNFLEELGEDSSREGLLKTPKRVSRMYDFLTKGYKLDVSKVINGAVFEEKYSEMVIVKDIDFFSLCEHHLIPFFGKCHVAYIPNGRIVGLSKIPRIVEVFARRLQVQERLTQQIAETLYQHLKPLGVAVVMEAQHLCMIMRGVEKLNSVAMTSAMLGAFRNDEKTRVEFLTLINRK